MNRLWALFRPDWSFLVVPLLLAFTNGCAPQTSSDGKQTIRNKNSESIGENGGEVGIDDGSKIVVPAGAVAAGTEVTVQKVADDPAFAVGVTSASSTVEIKAIGPDGVSIEVATQPMSIALAIDSGSSLHFSLYDLTSTFDNMCILLKTTSGKQMIWRRTLLTIDAVAKKVTIQSLYFGKYKAVYCGADPVSGFEDAVESGATGTAQLKIGMTISKDFAPDIVQGKYCFALVRGSSKDCEEASDENCQEEATFALVTGEKSRVAGSDNVLSLDVNTSLLLDGYEYFGAVSMMTADETCGLVAGKDVDETGPGNITGFFAFKVGIDLIKSGLEGVLGADDPYKLETVKVKLGGEGAFANLAAHDETNVCIDLDGTGGKTLRPVSFASGKIDGQTTLSVLAASPSGEAVDKARIRVGDRCNRFDTSFATVNLATGKPYEITKSVDAGDTVLLTPIKLRMTRTNSMPSVKNGCLRIYQPGTVNRPLGELMLSFDQKNFDIYVPYLTSTTSTVPRYDFEIIGLKQGDCSNAHHSENQAIVPVKQEGKELNATIDVMLPF